MSRNYYGIDLRLMNFDNHPIFKIHKSIVVPVFAVVVIVEYFWFSKVILVKLARLY